MKKKIKRLKFHQKGFSLVEVLCAIILLALVATPIIQIIYSSMTMNIKSKEMLASADLTSETMEYISSLVYDDLSYTKNGSPKIIKGAKSYYFGSTPGCLQSGKYYVCPSGVCGDKDSADCSSTKLSLKNVEYSGYKFRVIIQIEEDSATSTNTYHFYNVNVNVCDNNDKNHVLSQAKTCIPNKY